MLRFSDQLRARQQTNLTGCTIQSMISRHIGVGEKEQQFFGKIVQQKLLDVLRGSSGRNALAILEGKLRGKRAKGRPRRMWFDDVRQWTMLKDYNEVKRNAEDREVWRAITRQPST